MIPLAATYSLITLGDIFNKGRSTGRHSIKNPLPLPNKYLVTTNFKVDLYKDNTSIRAAIFNNLFLNAVKAKTVIFIKLYLELLVP